MNPSRPDLVDRERERAALTALLDRPGAQVALVTGRRRVGKTFLLTQTLPSASTFFFTATRTTPEQNRRQLILDLGAWSGEPLHAEDYPTWRAVFDLLWRTREGAPFAIVLDEFQYLASDDDGLADVASALNATFERRPSTRPLVVALSGSAVATLDGLASGGAPLYGRLALHLRLDPLAAFDVAAFVPDWTPRDRVAGYGVFGGTPAFWALVDPTIDLRSNVAALALARDGRVRLQLETLLAQEEGLGDVAAYQGVVRAVASGSTTRARIADATGLKNDHALVRRLETLVGLGHLAEDPAVEAPSNAPVRYRIADPALRFHHTFVTPNASMLERSDPHAVYDELVAPRLDTFLGPTFERLVAPTYERLRSDLGLPLVRTWGRWEGQDRDRRSIEVDVVAELVDGRVLSGAVKWNRKPLSAAVLFDHLGAVRRAAHAGRRWAHSAQDGPLLFLAAGGYEPAFRAAATAHATSVRTWTLEEIYAAPTGDTPERHLARLGGSEPDLKAPRRRRS